MMQQHPHADPGVFALEGGSSVAPTAVPLTEEGVEPVLEVASPLPPRRLSLPGSEHEDFATEGE